MARRHEGNGTRHGSESRATEATLRPGVFALASRGTLGAVETVGPASPVMRERMRTPEFAEDTLTHAARRFLRNLTPERIVQVFDGAATRIADQIQLAHELEESDDHLRGTLRLRRAAVLRLDVNVESGDPEDEQANAAAEALRDLIEQPWFRQASNWLLRATFLQHAAVEVLWKEGERGTGNGEQSRPRWVPCGVRVVEPGRFHFTKQRELLLRKKLWSDAAFVTPAAGKYMLHAVDATSTPGEFAIIRCVAKLAYLRSLDWINWGAMVDQWGVPVIEWTYPTGTSTEKIESIANEMLELAGRRLVAHEQGTTVTMHDVPEQAPHLDFDERVTRSMSRLLLGQDSAQQAIEGQKTGATLQGEVRDDLRDDDALLLDASQNETFVRPWCEWNFGRDVPPPRIVRMVRETKDPEQRGRVFLQARDLGLPVKRDQVYEELGIEAPGEGDKLLAPPMPPAPFGLQPQFPAAGATQAQPARVQPAESNQTPAATTPEEKAAVGAETVQETGLNGAQIKSLQELLQSVADGLQAPDVVRELIKAAFPTMDPVRIDRMVAAADRFRANRPAAEPVQGPVANPSAVLAARGVPRDSGLEQRALQPAVEALTRATDRLAAEAALMAARKAGSIEGISMVLSDEDVKDLGELIHLASFASYLASREAANEELAQRRGARTANRTARRYSQAVLASREEADDDIGVIRARFEEAIRSFESKERTLTKEEFLRLERQFRAKAFTVARQADRQILEALREKIGASISQGKSYREWLDETEQLVAQKGWEGLEPWHSRVVYHQNVDMAATVGRYDQTRAAGVQYWRYLPSEADSPRAEHQQYYGRIYRMGEGPMPPLDFGCRCSWEPVFDDELEGQRIEDEPPHVPADQEFQFAPADYFK